MTRYNQRPPKHKNTSRNILLSLLFAAVAIIIFAGSGLFSANVSQAAGFEPSPLQGVQSPDKLWKLADRSRLRARVESASPSDYQVTEVQQDALTQVLSTIPMEFTDAARLGEGVIISLPMPDGTFSRFRIEESPVLEPELAAQFPNVKSYRGQGVDDATATTRFDWGPNGFHAIVLSASGTVFIEPYTAGDTQNVISYRKEDLKDGFLPPQCEVTEAMQLSADLRDGTVAQEGFAATASVGTTLRTYRLALATTVEYTNNATYGGGKAATLVKLNTIVNLINAIYEREVSIRFILVSGELSIIFDAEPDGFTNSAVGTMLNESPTVLNAAIGSSAYDIGHVFGLAGAGSSSGVAQLSVVCGSSKGRGASVLGIALVTGTFSIDAGLVAHEWGHQFSATHTFNSNVNFCGSAGQRNASTAYEPGSGSTIMGYPGVCSPENLQQNGDSYFHTGSFDQIASYSAGTGNACAVQIATGNNPPTVSAGIDYTIPMGTPFMLTATGSDPNADPLVYSWEEFDTGAASPPMTDDGTRPLFRSFTAVTSPSRTFPKLSNILANTSTIGETLPVTTRSMNFRVTARDNRAAGGGVNSDAMVLSVTATSGPFVVTQPNTAVSWAGGSSQSVTWNVANTSGAPVNCANVKISLSTDGGNTFPTVIAASTPNDGTETVVVPNVSTSTARIKVEAVANVFFDISNANFTVTPTGGTIQQTVQTSPAGRSFTVDGTTYTSSQSFSWVPGSSHTISTTSPQSGSSGTQYVWSSWSDGGGISHTVAPTVPTTFTANFTTQYFLTMNAGAGGTVSPANNWFNSGQSVQISATPNAGFVFSGWTGIGTGSFTGSTNPASVTMNGPITESAGFSSVPRTLTIASVSPASGVNITVTPNDNNGQGSGVTQFSRIYNNNVVVNLTAPATAAGNSFQKWQRDGVDVTISLGTSVTMDANHTMTAVYVSSATKTPFDFDGDRKADIAVYRPSNGYWSVINSSDSHITVQPWGVPGDIYVPADYDGDGKTDFAIYRPSESNWWIVNSSTGQARLQQWGIANDVPVPADYDGDGKADVAIFRPSSGDWWIINSSNGQVKYQQWALSGDQPVPADYDGDGKADITVYRPSNGYWFVINSSDAHITVQPWGVPGDRAVPADYDGDGKIDFAIYRPSEGNWWIINSSTGQARLQQWGVGGDVPVSADYDGDGKADVAIYRPSSGDWWIINSSNGQVKYQQWAISGDVPLPAAFVK